MMVHASSEPAAVDLTVSAEEYDLLIQALAIAANRLDSRANVDTGGRNDSRHRVTAARLRTLKTQLWRGHRSNVASANAAMSPEQCVDAGMAEIASALRASGVAS